MGLQDGRTDVERHRATTAMRRRECLSGTAGKGVDGELPKSPAASGGKKTQRWARARLNLLRGYSPLDRTAHEIMKSSRAVLHWPNLSLATLGSR